MSSVNSKSDLTYPVRLTLNAIFLLLLLKIHFAVGSQGPMRSAYLISFVQDAFLLIANLSLFVIALGRFAPLRTVCRVLFMAFYIALTLFSIGYTISLVDLVGFSINVFSITTDTIAFFLNYILNVTMVCILLGGIAALLIGSWYFPRRLPRRWLLTGAMGALSTAFILTLLIGPAVNPIIFSVEEQIKLAAVANIHIRRLTAPVADGAKAEQFRFLNKAFTTIPQLSIHYDRVVVLVMETLNAATFADESQVDAGSFRNRHKDHLLTFTNYHTLNLESYTSLLAMLNSTFVPYQAYTNQERVEFLSTRNNLVRFFNTNGFDSFFITSAIDLPDRFVPDLADWSRIERLETVDETGQYVCMTTNKIEYACEDLAVFDNLVAALQAPRTFVLQELVYGHSPQWTETTGVTVVDYANRYFDRLVNHLDAQGLLDGTLLVLVADHGPRSDIYAQENYHIPLLIFATDLAPQQDDRFLSHLDFKDILLNVAAGETFTADQAPIYTIGNGGDLVYGMLAPGGRYVFINDRMRHVERNLPERDAIELNRDFQEYLNYFTWLGDQP